MARAHALTQAPPGTATAEIGRPQAGRAGHGPLGGEIEGILAAVVEFVRFAASRGWCEPAVAERLSFRAELRFTPRGWDRGERTGRPTVNRRVVRRRRTERPPVTLGGNQVGALVDACSNFRDRFVVEALYATGLRVSELCGLHLADLHLVPTAAHLGCRVAGAHLHVVRRDDNENGALAKSAWPRVVPVTTDLVRCHDAYRSERDAVAEAAESDYLLVNLWGGRCPPAWWRSSTPASTSWRPSPGRPARPASRRWGRWASTPAKSPCSRTGC